MYELILVALLERVPGLSQLGILRGCWHKSCSAFRRLVHRWPFSAGQQSLRPCV